ncbi:MAG: dTDP-4-dehydrorhamnose 3,5-epimerase [Bacteroidetes bacterium]|nr:dTDP-4-dehydrorhamnose 3,5-epimerase [Bacteroidota bacterium]
MNFIETHIPGLFEIEPHVFKDSRGNFIETHNEKAFTENGIDAKFVQDNQSMSEKNVLRGLHFQKAPFDQGKLVRVIKGAVLDVAVDIRKDQATYGQYFSLELSESNNKMIWIPPGFAHGFLALTGNTIFSYKCTNFYNKESEDGILWNDPTLNIDWGIDNPILSNKDLELHHPDYSKPLKVIWLCKIHHSKVKHIMGKVKCKKCGYTWLARVDTPKLCPKCKSRSWDKKGK